MEIMFTVWTLMDFCSVRRDNESKVVIDRSMAA